MESKQKMDHFESSLNVGSSSIISIMHAMQIRYGRVYEKMEMAKALRRRMRDYLSKNP